MMSLARVAIGAGLMAAPQLGTPLWIGRRGLTPAARLMARALGARDMGIGIGVLAGSRGGNPSRAWLVAGILADATDLVATVLERDHLPPTALPLVVPTAGGGIALGVIALAGGDGGAPAPVPA